MEHLLYLSVQSLPYLILNRGQIVKATIVPSKTTSQEELAKSFRNMLKKLTAPV